MKEQADVVIIGAGILGCFAARHLSRYRLKTVVLEQREDVCTGISRANTGIVYQGYDQHPGTLKASLCRKSAEGFPALCSELDVSYKRCGLLMLSYGSRADAVLEQKLRQGLENGVKGLKILSGSQVYDMEPFLGEGIRHALYSADTCVVNPWELGIAAYENARANGVSFYFREAVTGIAREDSHFLVETEHQVIRAERVLCCAGMQADTIWETVNRPRIRILPLGADYLVFDTYAGDRIHHVISVEPEEKGDDLTLVPTVNGNLLAGPTRREITGKADGTTDGAGLDELMQKCSRLVPSLPMDMIIRSFGAARPNPYVIREDGRISGKSIQDFAILEENGFFAMVGIKTPGITCADALGAHITERIIRSFDASPEINQSYNPIRKGIPKAAFLMEKDLQKLEQLPAAYHEIICRCRNVSKGEILEAIRRGASTLDAVKRRTGSSTGRCQGGYCTEKIMHLLAEELGVSIYDITKDGPGSQMILQGRNDSEHHGQSEI